MKPYLILRVFYLHIIMVKVNKNYYLKRYQKKLMTSRDVDSEILVDIIENELVYFHYVNDPNSTYASSLCRVHEFSKIFCSKPLNKQLTQC